MEAGLFPHGSYLWSVKGVVSGPSGSTFGMVEKLQELYRRGRTVVLADGNAWADGADGEDLRVPFLPRVAIRLTRCFLPVFLATILAYLPEYAGLSIEGRAAILTFTGAIGLWICKALPTPWIAIVVVLWSFLVFVPLDTPVDSGDRRELGLPFSFSIAQLSLLGMYATGLLMTAAVHGVQLVDVVLKKVLERVGERPWWVLAICMGIVFLFSSLSFGKLSAIAMLTLFVPVLHALAGGDPLRNSLTLGMLWAVQLGEVALVIGASANIAVAFQSTAILANPVGVWLLAIFMPVLLLLVICWGFLLLRYPAWVERIAFHRTPIEFRFEENRYAKMRRTLILFTIVVTLVFWIVFHQQSRVLLLSCAVTSSLLCISGAVKWETIKRLPWGESLVLLMALSLGWIAYETSLVAWLKGALGRRWLDSFGMTLAFGYLGWILACFMPRVAVAAVLAPFCAIIAPSSPIVAPMTLVLSLAASASFSASELQTSGIRKSLLPKPVDQWQVAIGLGLISPMIAWVWGTLFLPSDWFQ